MGMRPGKRVGEAEGEDSGEVRKGRGVEGQGAGGGVGGKLDLPGGGDFRSIAGEGGVGLQCGAGAE